MARPHRKAWRRKSGIIYRYQDGRSRHGADLRRWPPEAGCDARRRKSRRRRHDECPHDRECPAFHPAKRAHRSSWRSCHFQSRFREVKRSAARRWQARVCQPAQPRSWFNSPARPESCGKSSAQIHGLRHGFAKSSEELRSLRSPSRAWLPYFRSAAYI